MLDARVPAIDALPDGEAQPARSLDDDVVLLRDALTVALRTAGGDGMLETELNPAELDAREAQRRVLAMTRHLQLANLAEDNDRIRRLRRQEQAAAPDPPPGGLHAAIAE